MKEGYTSDCYICTMDNFDVICDTLINRGCNILNAVPTDYYINGAYINATRMCITYERPNTPAGRDIEKNLDYYLILIFKDFLHNFLFLWLGNICMLFMYMYNLTALI